MTVVVLRGTRGAGEQDVVRGEMVGDRGRGGEEEEGGRGGDRRSWS